MSSRATLARSGVVGSPDLAEEPGLRGLPIAHDGLGGDVQDMGCFLHCQAAKKSQLDNLAHTSIERRQSAERIAERNQVVLLRVCAANLGHEVARNTVKRI